MRRMSTGQSGGASSADAAARAESMARQVGAPGEYAGEDSFRVVREALGLKGGVT